MNTVDAPLNECCLANPDGIQVVGTHVSLSTSNLRRILITHPDIKALRHITSNRHLRNRACATQGSQPSDPKSKLQPLKCMSHEAKPDLLLNNENLGPSDSRVASFRPTVELQKFSNLTCYKILPQCDISRYVCQIVIARLTGRGLQISKLAKLENLKFAA